MAITAQPPSTLNLDRKIRLEELVAKIAEKRRDVGTSSIGLSASSPPLTFFFFSIFSSVLMSPPNTVAFCPKNAYCISALERTLGN